MTTYHFQGPYETTYPGHVHPAQPGVLVAIPGELVEFGDQLPPTDGNWYDSDGNPVLAGPGDVAAEPEDSPGTGADAEPNAEE